MRGAVDGPALLGDFPLSLSCGFLMVMKRIGDSRCERKGRRGRGAGNQIKVRCPSVFRLSTSTSSLYISIMK